MALSLLLALALTVLVVVLEPPALPSQMCVVYQMPVKIVNQTFSMVTVMSRKTVSTIHNYNILAHAHTVIDNFILLFFLIVIMLQVETVPAAEY